MFQFLSGLRWVSFDRQQWRPREYIHALDPLLGTDW
jgi:hypothetical protein